MTHTAAVTDQLKFRGREDSGNEATPTWIDSVNTNWTQAVDTDFRVRFEVGETAGATNPEVITPSLYYSLNGGTYLLVTASTPVQFGTFTGATDGDATTQQLGTASFSAGELDDDGTMSDTAGLSNQSTEFEWCLTIDSAQVSNSDTIALQARDNANTLDNYTNTPTITALAAANTNVPLALGTYTLAGLALDLSIDTTVSLAAGSYALSGQTLDVTKNITSALDTGSYALSGLALDIAANRSVALDAGTYTLSGQTLDVLTADTTDIPLAAGSYTLAGLALTEAINRSAPLDAGVYTLSGLALSESVATNVSLEVGVYTLSGLDLAVSADRSAALDAGSYTLNGPATTELLNRPVDLAAGSYALSGLDITVITTGTETVSFDAGSYSLTGANLNVDVTASTPVVSSGGGSSRGGSVDRDDQPEILERIQRMLDAEKGIKPPKTKAAKARRAKRKEKIRQVELDLKLFQTSQPDKAAEYLAELKASLAEVDKKLAADMRAIGDEIMIRRIIEMYDDDLALVLLLAA